MKKLIPPLISGFIVTVVFISHLSIWVISPPQLDYNIIGKLIEHNHIAHNYTPPITSDENETDDDLSQSEQTDIYHNEVETNNQPTIQISTRQAVQNLEDAKEQNSDSLAWLEVPNTNIDNVVVQTTDNDYYLRRDFNQNFNAWGCYFFDYMSTPLNPMQNTVIYGHSEIYEDINGKDFSQLFRYADIDFLKENQIIYLTMDNYTLEFEICAVFYSDINFYYIAPNPFTQYSDTFIDTINSKNLFIFENELTENDKLLTLSTCSTKYDIFDTTEHRFVVMGKLVDSSNYVPNNMVYNPQPELPIEKNIFE